MSEPLGTSSGRVPQGHAPAGRAVDLTLSRNLARLMDDLVTVPGTRFGIGLDALIGLVPGIGDLVGSTLSGAILYDAVRCRVPIQTLARMGWNLVLDAALGLVPGVGDLLDVAHRANRTNLRLLERAVQANPHPEPPSPGYLLAAVTLAVLPVLLGLAVGAATIWFLVSWVRSR